MSRILSYDYNASKKLYWIPLRKANDTDLIQKDDTTNVQSPQTLSYYSDTGQLSSNCFFFIEGIDSDVVKTKIKSILSTTESLSEHNDVRIIGNQDMVASYVFKYVIQNNSCEFQLMDDCLTYLATASSYLADKIGTTKTLVNSNRRLLSIDGNHISRCSYKFCAQTYCCQYNYPENKRKKVVKGCYSDHFAHGKVYQDIVSLQSYVRMIHEKGDSDTIVIRSNQEIIKCINTIAYVIKHMYDELWNIYISCNKKPSYEALHKNVT